MTSVGDAGSVRAQWIDVTRGLAVILVVFYHVVIALAVTPAPAPAWATALNGALAPFRIPALIFCSGLLLPRSLRKPTGQFVVGKLRNIAWPYLVWTMATVVLLVGGSQLAGEGNTGPSRVWAIVTAPGTYTWYLAYLLAFYLVSLLVPARVRQWSIPLLFGVSMIVDDGDGWTRVTFLLAFFFLGDTVARHLASWLSVARRRWVLVLAVVVVVTTAAVGSQVALRYGPATIAGVLALVILAEPAGARVARTRVGGWLMLAGRNSIVFYTTHWIVVTACVHVLTRAGLNNGNALVAVLMALGLAVPALVVALRGRSAWVMALYVFPAIGRHRVDERITTGAVLADR